MSTPKNSKKVIESLKNLRDDKEKMNEIGEKLKQAKEIELKNLREFKTSGKFNTIVKEIHNYLKSNTHILDNVYKEPLFSNVSNEEFMLTFDCVFSDLCPILSPQTDPSIEFENEYIIFEGLIFSRVYGQGTSFCVTKK